MRPINLGEVLADIEKRLIRNALIYGGTIKEAADLLGIGRTTLVYKLKTYQAHLIRASSRGRVSGVLFNGKAVHGERD